MANLKWLCSYPRSGNTWVRLFLQYYRSRGAVTAMAPRGVVMSAGRTLFLDSVGIDAANLTRDEIEDLRFRLYGRLGETEQGPIFLKCHDAFKSTLFPASALHRVLHIVRNPLDVVTSMARYEMMSLSKSIEFLNNSKAALCADHSMGYHQLPQDLGSWDQHTRSWMSLGASVLLVRYEDLLTRPEFEFRRILEHLEVEVETGLLQDAVTATDFRRVSSAERTEGFHERYRQAPLFFGGGESAYGKNLLTQEQIGEIINTHGPTMRLLGYEV